MYIDGAPKHVIDADFLWHGNMISEHFFFLFSPIVQRIMWCGERERGREGGWLGVCWRSTLRRLTNRESKGGSRAGGPSLPEQHTWILLRGLDFGDTHRHRRRVDGDGHLGTVLSCPCRLRHPCNGKRQWRRRQLTVTNPSPRARSAGTTRTCPGTERRRIPLWD
jgi:hypothetical protein